MSEALRDPMELLAHTAWARRLAQALVSTDADDLCQETLLQAMRQPPGARSPRAWLTTVMRNLRQTRFRAEARRQAREQAAAPPVAAPSPEESLARMELQRVLAERVAALEEPYRQTLLLRYFDELSAAQIAERLGTPAGTVRWRLKTALDRLRADLDGRQPRWRREWALIAVRPAAKPAAAASGGLLFSVKAATAVAALVTLGTGWRAVARVPESKPPAQLHASSPVVAVTAAPSFVGPLPASPPRPAPPASVVAGADDFVPFERLPPALLKAFVAAEDRRFYEHHGLNIHATIHSLLSSDTHGPRSTITQQLAKLTLGEERSFGSKLREAFLARDLESRYSKDEILTMFVNRVFLGHGAFGVAAAARRYFGKSASELDVAECALLAGIVRAPIDSSPLDHPEAALARRNDVLEKMVETGALGRADANRWLARPVR